MRLFALWAFYLLCVIVARVLYVEGALAYGFWSWAGGCAFTLLAQHYVVSLRQTGKHRAVALLEDA